MENNSVLDMPYEGNAFAPQYVGFWPRVGAWLIDAVLLGVVQQITSFAIVQHSTFSNRGLATITGLNLLVTIINLVLGITYFTVMESSEKQATIGKMAIGAKVVDEQGNRISTGKALGRYLSKILSGLIFCIGFIMVGFDSKKQGLHDKIAGTFVVHKVG